MDIVWLGHGNCHDYTIVGDKEANLCRLAAAHRVPPAFCLTTTAFARWLPAGKHEVAGLPAGLYTQLACAYRRLADVCGSPDLSVAVRSSAVEEDGRTVSFAGQHATCLNVVGIAAVAQVVLYCWASACSPHALAYRRRQGLAEAEIQMAVLVQQMILADVSAVIFSANPLTGCRDEIVINASWGLGESIVSGLVNPDVCVVRKTDLAVVEYLKSDKRITVVPAPSGTRHLPTPRWLRTQPALTPAGAVGAGSGKDDRLAGRCRVQLSQRRSLFAPVQTYHEARYDT
jgi:pyruvate,water dikinase